MTRHSFVVIVAIVLTTALIGGCSKGNSNHENNATDSTSAVTASAADTVSVSDIVAARLVLTPDMEVADFIRMSPDSALYSDGIFDKIIEASPEYARRLINSEYDKFIIVDKNTMAVILYDRYGRQLQRYPMACSRKYGTKHAKADNRTPEGFFKVYGVYDSQDWMFIDDNGVKSDIKGQFGPKFIRLNIPGTFQIGIHGTCAPWSIGGRRSHGCIRLTNENILKLVELVDSGMPVIVNPGPRDAAMNEIEGCEIPLIDLNGRLLTSVPEHVRLLRAEMERDSLNALAADTLVQPNDTPLAPRDTLIARL